MNIFSSVVRKYVNNIFQFQNTLKIFSQNSIREMSNHRHKKLIKLAKGYTGRTNCYTVALQRVTKAREYAYIGRKLKKRDMRSLWIQRINAGARMYGTKYNDIIHKMSNSNVILNRNVLAELAVTEPLSFKSVIETVNIVSKKAKHAKKSEKKVKLSEEAADIALKSAI